MSTPNKDNLHKFICLYFQYVSHILECWRSISLRIWNFLEISRKILEISRNIKSFMNLISNRKLAILLNKKKKWDAKNIKDNKRSLRNFDDDIAFIWKITSRVCTKVLICWSIENNFFFRYSFLKYQKDQKFPQCYYTPSIIRLRRIK